MADDVNSIEPAHNHVSRTHWQKLGEQKLRADSNLDGTIKTWLTQILSDFSLPNDFASRLLKSLEEAAVRVLIPGGSETPLEYLEIVVLAPADLTFRGKTWGFFRLERTSTEPGVNDSQGHCIEYYLYLDRKSGEDEHTP